MNRSFKITNSFVLLTATLFLAGCIGQFTQPADSKLEHITTANFDERVLKAPGPVLVDFYADWCGPCQRLGPILEAVAAERPDVRVLKVNVDNNAQLAQRFGVQGIPHLFVFRGGQVVADAAGFQEKAAIIALIGPPAVAATAPAAK